MHHSASKRLVIPPKFGCKKGAKTPKFPTKSTPNDSFPSCIRGFDSLRPLQTSRRVCNACRPILGKYRPTCIAHATRCLERAKGIEPSYAAWERVVRC